MKPINETCGLIIFLAILSSTETPASPGELVRIVDENGQLIAAENVIVGRDWYSVEFVEGKFKAKQVRCKKCGVMH